MSSIENNALSSSFKNIMNCLINCTNAHLTNSRHSLIINIQREVQDILSLLFLCTYDIMTIFTQLMNHQQVDNLKIFCRN